MCINYQIEQLEHESNRFDGQIKESENERDKLIATIRKIDHDLHSAQQTIQQRNSIIQEKVVIVICSFYHYFKFFICR